MARHSHDLAQLAQALQGTHFEHVYVAAGARAHVGHHLSLTIDDPLRQLRLASNAPYSRYSRQHDPYSLQYESTCLEGTRVEVLQEIREWAEGSGRPSIFWLNGRAGTGKSTIARTIAQYYATPEQSRLGGSFFFARGGKDVSHARHFVTTIALQLAAKTLGLRRSISQVVSENVNITNSAIHDQWNRLVVEPIAQQDGGSMSWPILIVVDALDECEYDSETKTILHILSEIHNGPAPDRIRVFLTSRPEVPIRAGFRRMPAAIHHDLVLHQVSRETVDRDIQNFIQHEFKQIVLDSEHLLNGWPSKEQIRQLMEKADGLFIVASTMCRYIANDQYSPQELLQDVLAPRPATLFEKGAMTSKQPTLELDKIYTQVLERPFTKLPINMDISDLLRTLRLVLGLIAIAAEPLSASAIALLIHVHRDVVETRIQHLHAVLDVPRDALAAVRISHPSFREFLIDKTRCQNEDFWIDEKVAHVMVTDGCLRVMSALKRNVCAQDDSKRSVADVDSSHIQHCIPMDLQYACLYWIHHLQQSEARVFGNGPVYGLLLEHFLYWLEALSWIRRISHGVLALRQLSLSIDADRSPELDAFVNDAIRFVIHARPCIEQYPLQVYISAIVSTPTQSIVRKHFELQERPLWIVHSPYVGEHWSSLLQTLQGHTASVTDVAFSPDRKTLASASQDSTVRLWDIETGGSIQILQGHSDEVTQVVFSPDGQTLASTSCDGTVRLWDVEVGGLVHVLKGHSDASTQVSFWSDGRTVALASEESTTVRLWDVEKGVSTQTVNSPSTQWWTEVAFSPDGRTLASRREDVIQLWDTEKGVLTQTLKGHSHWVTHVRFSADGKMLASASRDSTVRLWDIEKGALKETLRGHSHWVTQVAFSPDGKTLASASRDSTVRLWDGTRRWSARRLKGRFDEITQMVFSPNGQALALASRDSSVQTWDPESGKLTQTLEGHSDGITGVIFSQDGKTLASASNDSTVRLWDVEMREPRETIEGHSDEITQVVFSPDGQTLASASYDSTVRLWDAKRGWSRQTLRGHSYAVTQVVFSPDGQVLASASNDSTVRIWDTESGGLAQTLQGHSDGVACVVFSPNGSTLASASNDSTIRLWDAERGWSTRMLAGQFEVATHMAFSPDGQTLATTHADDSTQYWETATGASRGRPDDFGDSRGSEHASIRLETEWIAYKAGDAAWLPPELRSDVNATFDNTAAFGHESGHVSFWEFMHG